MVVNLLQLGGVQSGKFKDIKIDNIDVLIGGSRILIDIILIFVYGYCYGFVGNNGVGKFIFLRVLF